MAEWSCSGLQSRLRRFDSDPSLISIPATYQEDQRPRKARKTPGHCHLRLSQLDLNVMDGMKSMRWHQPLPNWARLVCVLFGLANIGGAMAQFSEMTIPGIIVGAIWALFGWKGLPLVSSSSVNAPLDAGLRAIRRRRIVALAVPIAWLPCAAMLLPRVHRLFLPTVFFLSGIPVFFLVFGAFSAHAPAAIGISSSAIAFFERH